MSRVTRNSSQQQRLQHRWTLGVAMPEVDALKLCFTVVETTSLRALRRHLRHFLEYCIQSPEARILAL